MWDGGQARDTPTTFNPPPKKQRRGGRRHFPRGSPQAPKCGALGPLLTPEAGVPLSTSPGMKSPGQNSPQAARGQGSPGRLHPGNRLEWEKQTGALGSVILTLVLLSSISHCLRVLSFTQYTSVIVSRRNVCMKNKHASFECDVENFLLMGFLVKTIWRPLLLAPGN